MVTAPRAGTDVEHVLPDLNTMPNQLAAKRRKEVQILVVAGSKHSLNSARLLLRYRSHRDGGHHADQGFNAVL